MVISIIAMLMALLLPAVQSAREAGRRNTCQNNQHQVATALQLYVSAKNYYPGWSNVMNGAVGAGAGPAATLTSSTVAATQAGAAQIGNGTYILPLLQYMERNDIYNNYSQMVTTLLAGTSPSAAQSNAFGQSQVYIAGLICPSNPPLSQSGTPLAYIINAGQIDTSGYPVPMAAQSSTLYGTGSAYSPTIQIAAAVGSGIAFDQTYSASSSGASYVTTQSTSQLPVLKVTQDQINSQDGTSYTLLLSENTLQGSSWSMWASQGAGQPAIYNSSYAGWAVGNKALYPLFFTTFMWANNTTAGSSTPPTDTTGGSSPTSTTFLRINGDKNSTTANDIIHARPASNHPGICVFTFCDGHIRTLSEDIDYRVYKQLMTPNGGNTGVITAPPPINGSGDVDSGSTILNDSSF